MGVSSDIPSLLLEIQQYKMHFKVLVVLAVSAIIAVDGGVLKREKRTLGLVKYAAAHPVKAAAALIGKCKENYDKYFYIILVYFRCSL